jgi:trehalose synthase
MARAATGAVLAAVAPGDVVVLHDPQTAGLAGALKRHGAHVVWRCHVGRDVVGPVARAAWDFLCADVGAADVCVFSPPHYAWDVLAPERVVTLAPCIDVASPKNEPLDQSRCDAILDAAGIVPRGGSGPPVRRAIVTEVQPVPPDARVVVQVSRWDRLKDPVGLIRAFGLHGPEAHDAHLLVVGPAVDGVGDDPEGADAFVEACAAWRDLTPSARRRIHLVCVPMDDPAENAPVVNAVQRRADVVVQKSLAEGFGLTVAEAMWKRRPVVASRVGGVQDQIVHGESGVLVDDPADLVTFGQAIRRLIADRAGARALGEAAHRRVCDRYLPVHHFAGECALVERLVA